MKTMSVYNVKNVYIKASVNTPDGGSVPINSNTPNHTVGLCNYDTMLGHLNYMFNQFFLRNRKSDFESFVMGFECFDIDNPNVTFFVEKNIKSDIPVNQMKPVSYKIEVAH